MELGAKVTSRKLLDDPIMSTSFHTDTRRRRSGSKRARRPNAAKPGCVVSDSDLANAASAVSDQAPFTEEPRVGSGIEYIAISQTPDAPYAEREAVSIEQPQDPAAPSDSQQKP